jgi:hypothetical protein
MASCPMTEDCDPAGIEIIAKNANLNKIYLDSYLLNVINRLNSNITYGGMPRRREAEEAEEAEEEDEEEADEEEADEEEADEEEEEEAEECLPPSPIESKRRLKILATVIALASFGGVVGSACSVIKIMETYFIDKQIIPSLCTSSFQWTFWSLANKAASVATLGSVPKPFEECIDMQVKYDRIINFILSALTGSGIVSGYSIFTNREKISKNFNDYRNYILSLLIKLEDKFKDASFENLDKALDDVFSQEREDASSITGGKKQLVNRILKYNKTYKRRRASNKRRRASNKRSRASNNRSRASNKRSKASNKTSKHSRASNKTSKRSRASNRTSN